MKKILVLTALLLVGACGEEPTAPTADSAWQLPAGVSQRAARGESRTISQPPLALSRSERGKPLSVLVGDEVERQPLDGLSVNGVSFSYDGPSAWYNTFGPTPGPFVDCPCIEGVGLGSILTMTFDKPTQFVAFGFSQSTFLPVEAGFLVDVIGPNGKSRGSFTIDTEPAPFFSGARFVYSRNAVKQLVVTIPPGPGAGNFAVDNITYHRAPR